MAYSAVSIPTSITFSATFDITKENKVLLHSLSTKSLLSKQSTIIRSYSTSNLMFYSSNRIHATSMQPKHKGRHSILVFPLQFPVSILQNPLRSFLFDPTTMREMNMGQKGINIKENMVEKSEVMINRVNWVQRLTGIKRYWRRKLHKDSMEADILCKHNSNSECDCDEDGSVCVAGYEEGVEKEEDGQEVTCDRDSFSKFLVPVPWSDAKPFSKLAFLCNMAYDIPQIKATDLGRYYGLQFVTSSLEKKGDMTKINSKLDQDSICVPMDVSAASKDGSQKDDGNKQKHQIKLAYHFTASAASYVQSRAKDLLSLASKSKQHSGVEDFNGREDSPHEEADETPQVYKSKFGVNISELTRTVVVAAGTAMDLQLLRSSSCEWFVCDDPDTYTRCFAIQGSYSVASWQANLYFEPTTFEGTDVLVHSGIYEAAKGIYEQLMPEIMDHLKRYGDNAKLQFTGHSLGGTLSLLVYLMLLTGKVVSPSTLLPVVTFGSPFVLCGGQKLLNELGLDESYIHCVMLHRDIVPRIFSCSFPNHVITVLKHLNGSFGSHPCLMESKLLYSPLGKIFILQPDEKTSPPHPLLPSGSGFYALDNSRCGYSPIVLRTFLNQPHPIEILSNPTAYGSDGRVLRDHDCNNYLKAVNGVFRQHSSTVFRTERSKQPQNIFKKKLRK